MEKCAANTSGGKPCRAWRGEGSEFCRIHDPRFQDQVAEARRRGGHNAHRQPPSELPDVVLDSADAACRLIDDTISRVRRGEISEKLANTIAYLVNVRRQERAAAELEARLEEIEEAVLPAVDTDPRGPGR